MSTVHLYQPHIAQLERIASALRPEKTETRDKLWVGRVSALHGEAVDGNVAGDVVLALQGSDNELLKTRVYLEADDYATACDAHRDDHYVQVRGKLHLGRRLHRLKDASHFKDMERPST